MKPSDQLTRKKPLRQFRKKKRPGNRAPTKDEAARIVAHPYVKDETRKGGEVRVRITGGPQ